MKAVHFRDGRACDIRIQDTYPEAFLCHAVCQGGGHHGFTDAAFSADHADDVSYIGINILVYQKAGLLGGASLAALLCAALIAAAFSAIFISSCGNLII